MSPRKPAVLRDRGGRDLRENTPQLRPAGSGTVAGNLALFIDRGLEVLGRVTFDGLLSQPKVLTRFHAMVGGDAAFGAAGEDSAAQGASHRQGLPDLLTAYLRGIAPASAP